MSDEEKIWQYLISSGLNEYGAAGLMGNLYAESLLKPNNLENAYNKKLNLTDQQYTENVDNNTYTNFVNDNAGYGLAQWTWWSRKKALYQFSKEKNKSIGDLELQLDFLLKELNTTFIEILKILKNAKSIKEASDIVLIKFEAPYDQSDNAKERRASFGLQFYNKYASKGGNYMSSNTFTKGVKVQLSKNFDSTEFDCHGKGCCSQTLINPKLIDIIQNIREHFGKPITITSGYRCTKHNSSVGGATGSKHTKGDAADIVISGVSPAEVAKYAESIGVKGIGLYETSSDGYFTHIDARENKAFWYGQSCASRNTFGGSSGTSTNSSIFNSTTVNQNVVTLLKTGSSGDKVKSLQEDLNSLGYDCGAADGLFGAKTRNAVIKFQKEHELDQDGIAGEETLAVISKLKNSIDKNNELSKKVQITANLLNVRNSPNISGSIVGRLQYGSIKEIIEEENGWGKISENGWICMEYVKEI